jgi:septal ring factor EnvC (AmiA/AmiB activator)|nr:MAG TPA: RuvA, C-terminal domain [Caudoviricetes sp.]
MFRFFIRTKKKSDPILEMLREENERLDKILIERQKETAKVEEEIAKAENALRALGYTDKDLKRLVQKGKMKVIKSEDED